VGGWLAENGIGVGSYEYGWLLQNVLSVEVVVVDGERSIIEGSEALRHFIGYRGSTGLIVRAWLATRRASGDVPAAALFRDTGDLGKAVMDLDRGGVPLWHLGFLNTAMARRFEIGPVLLGAYPKESTLGRVCPEECGRGPSGGSPFPRGCPARLGAEVLPGETPGTNSETGPGVGSR
jgi:FAD/FMN-containing dehydrogenase